MESQSRKKPGPKPKPIPEVKTCIECAETKPYAEFPHYRNSCKVCVSKYRKALYARRKEARKASRDMAKSREACRRWRAKNRDSEHIKAGRRERYQKNKEALNALSKAYKEKHKARLGFMQHKFRARKHGVLSTATYEEWVALCDHYQNRCLCCGEQKPLTVDHVIALVLGGPHTIDNLQPLCKECHMKKNVRMTDYRPAATVIINSKFGEEV